jgi:xylulokinase
VIPGCYYIMGGLYTSGVCVDWLRNMLLPDGDPSYHEYLALASAAPAGSGGVFFVPHLRVASPPQNDPKARGTFIGLSTDTTRGALARAVLEGLAYESFYSASAMAGMVDRPIESAVVVGGGTRNDLLMRIKAAVYDRTLEIVETEEATTLGAALLAGLGVGLYRDVADAGAHLQIGRRAVAPDPALVSLYAERYQAVYVHIYTALRDLHHTISERFIAGEC